jgi:hypothetical protein
MPPAIAVYPAGPCPSWRLSPCPPILPQAAPFDARNYIPHPSPPQRPRSTQETTCLRTRSSPQICTRHTNHVRARAPSIPLCSCTEAASSPRRTTRILPLVTPQSSSSGSSLYPQSPAGTMTRSISAHPTEREAARLYDRPGTWRPRFQMPRSGVSSLLPNLSRGKSFPPGTFRLFTPTHLLSFFF